VLKRPQWPKKRWNIGLMKNKAKLVLPEMVTIDEKERGYWVAVVESLGLGPKNFFTLYKAFGSAKTIWQVNEQKLRDLKIAKSVIAGLKKRKKQISPSEHLKVLAKMGVRVVCVIDEEYPKLLKEIESPPPVLFVKGKLAVEDNVAIAVVGTRTPSSYGKEMTRRMVEGLVANGFTIVSGLAYGIDGVAHTAALEAGGRTIAFLGGGIDQPSPGGHRGLAERISRHGAVIAEFAPGQPVLRGNFPARNRLISGMSLGVLVTEGAGKSGTKLTAEHAFSQGRYVFAVPGQVTNPMSEAPLSLVKRGGKLVTGVDDIINEISNDKLQIANKIQISKSKIQTVKFDNKEEEKLYELLSEGEKSFDELVGLSGLDVSQVAKTLTMLEMKMVVRDVGGKIYCIV